jgi:hypothetical protein
MLAEQTTLKYQQDVETTNVSDIDLLFKVCSTLRTV